MGHAGQRGTGVFLVPMLLGFEYEAPSVSAQLADDVWYKEETIGKLGFLSRLGGRFITLDSFIIQRCCSSKFFRLF